ncbi:hypothetical protein [Galactobacter valiniphilus]|uniref:hypothetical protein n=1 Tax=Galactobacter valiniphilus TaxID=2676122 RepID=UPI00373684AC
MYKGYLAVDAAAVVKVLGLGDSWFRDHEFCPRATLVVPAVQLGREAPRSTGPPAMRGRAWGWRLAQCSAVPAHAHRPI